MFCTFRVKRRVCLFVDPLLGGPVIDVKYLFGD